MDRRTRRRRHGLAWIVLSLILAIPSAADAQGWKQKIDQLWSDQASQNPTEICQMYVVRAMPPLIRGSMSGHGCVVNAIVAAREGDSKLAVAWLRAGYCRDKRMRMRIDSVGNAAAEYAVRKFGSLVP